MDFQFPTELEGFRSELREFVRRELPADWAGGDVEDADPETVKAIRKKLAARNWLTIAWPQEYGEMGASHLQQLVFNEEMAYHRVPSSDSGISILDPILMSEGTEEQKATHLPPIASANVRWAKGYSEPDSGSDLAVEVEVSRIISYHIGWLHSRGEVFNREASMGKLFGSEMVQRLHRAGMSMLGLYGTLTRDSKWAPLQGRIERGFLTSFSSTIAAGTSEIQRNVIATRGLGLPRG